MLQLPAHVTAYSALSAQLGANRLIPSVYCHSAALSMFTRMASTGVFSGAALAV